MAVYSTISQRLSLGPTVRPASLPSLSLPSTTAPQLPHHDKAAQAKPLWLCAYFPDLPLEAANCAAGAARPFAIFEENGGRRLVYMASAAAGAVGITHGMWLSQAYALCPALEIRPRDMAAERNRLSRLAIWAARFTPMVSLQPPQALLLEISGSLKLFGGLIKLKAELIDGLSASGACAQIAITPAPLASLLLASQGQSAELSEPEALRSALGRLPVSVLPLATGSIQRLLNSGVRDLHDLWRLPRESLARRFGPELLDFLDRALGLRPDPRRTFSPPPCFTAELELIRETDNTAALLDAARSLLTRLVKFLRERDGAIIHLRLDLCDAQSPPSQLRVGTRHGTRDEEHLLNLLGEHLHRFRLPAPVLKLRLTTAAIQPFTTSNETLFATKYGLANPPLISPFRKGFLAKGEISKGFHKHKREKSTPDWQQILEKLQVRLGSEAVRGLESLADHRPERAWSYIEPGGQGHTINGKQRPLWLFPNPRPLVSRQGHPWRRGPLSITKNPERIEGGWWDGRDIRRDYYIATDDDGSRLWIFRDLRGDRAWYLHGLFG